ncbi:uncharacterized protein LOC129571184 [Sitodiplosis mosellana]|uniref:uncharacterized protein LOC129571184 n=1 Tax=Sitodiplosis mosellana TaxID=263140 RepID=UPI002444A4DB|nr:uncharacterized protein LOC129571184 [Sitodiplosis mosellana]
MKQNSLILNVILLSCIPLFMCQTDLLTDDFAAPTSSLSDSHLPNALQGQYDDSQIDYGESLPQSHQYGATSPNLQLITKHVYVHIPPNEPEFQSSQTFKKSIPKKHYNIIFIKAPTPPRPTVPVIPTQDEHKTLVYILVKKPEPLPRLEIPQAETTEPSKPEVFFVKYKGSNDH